ncbi:ABC transporter ATP-binding protein [Modestobacter sp. VKM Ac-2979]|uniref:ABC transporter ATP-binding protein n=1 Tax=unclassified Modestobacter TaxID=2643866 RepID=UPI0022ABAAFC|nr:MULTISPECIES: ABC transporter ATP-binding protein [unclassified Modestobacter]MCZ2810323.1 ABC transporter ATP-binding protein [Modestobacter sp. VKM Ac-2979]MCZ2841809.1 ABC transporter ATP-binding protein [Modestobacter sp. VKM Ac-2980]
MSTIGTSGPAMSGATSTGTMTQGRTTSLPDFDPAAPLLEVTDLNVRFPTEDGLVHAVRGVDYSLRSGEVLGIVGESGSGKSVTSLAVMGLLPGSARVTGSIKYRGQELLGQSDRSMSRIRGKGVSMIFQDPMTSLDPVYKVGAQIEETLRIHDKQLSSKAAEARAVELLELVGIPNAGDRVDAYPHEFSGGMRQRVVIAIAMANQPEVIIADEPTTALDVTVQAQILEVLQTALQETGAAMVMITHDLGVVAGIADRVLVMYAGRPVEIGSVEDIYYEPRMPYTLGLLGSLPRLDSATRERLTPIQGAPPSVVNMPPGCPFAPRCPLHIAECDEAEPERFQVGPGHTAACIRTEEVAAAHGRAADIFSESAADATLEAARVPAGVADAQSDLDGDGPAVPPGDQTAPRAGQSDAGTQSVVSAPPRPTNGDRA